MKASELIEKIHNGEIKSGTKIICHKKNEYFGYKITRYFMGNWFSKVPPEEHTSNEDVDEDMILSLCDKYVTYEIIDENDMQYDLGGVCQDCMYLEKIKPLFEQLQQENQQLKLINKEYERLNKENGRGFTITSVKQYNIDELVRCKDNWNKLKEFMSYQNINSLIEQGYETNDFISEIRSKIEELERGVSDVED